MYPGCTIPLMKEYTFNNIGIPDGLKCIPSLRGTGLPRYVPGSHHHGPLPPLLQAALADRQTPPECQETNNHPCLVQRFQGRIERLV